MPAALPATAVSEPPGRCLKLRCQHACIQLNHMLSAVCASADKTVRCAVLCAVAAGRPVDLLQLPDGSLLVSDDGAGCVWRVTYSGN